MGEVCGGWENWGRGERVERATCRLHMDRRRQMSEVQTADG